MRLELRRAVMALLLTALSSVTGACTLPGPPAKIDARRDLGLTPVRLPEAGAPDGDVELPDAPQDEGEDASPEETGTAGDADTDAADAGSDAAGDAAPDLAGDSSSDTKTDTVPYDGARDATRDAATDRDAGNG